MTKYRAIKAMATGAVFAAGLFLFTTQADAAKNFTDLDKLGSHRSAVQELNQKGAFDHMKGNKFNGGSGVTRKEVSKILYNLYADESETYKNYNGNFKDINPKTEFYKEMVWSYETGIFDGDNGKFNPNQVLSRAQMAKVLVSAFNFKARTEGNFKDVSWDHWSYPHIGVLYTTGISVGQSDGKYGGGENVTLAQLATFIQRFEREGGIQPLTAYDKIDTTGLKTKEEVLQMQIDIEGTRVPNKQDVYFYTDHNPQDYYDDLFETSNKVPGGAVQGAGSRTTTYKKGDKYLNIMSSGNFWVDGWNGWGDYVGEDDFWDWESRLDKMEKHIVENNSLTTDYEVLKAVSDFVSKGITYGVDFADDDPFFVNRPDATYCGGYTDVTNELLYRFGIESIRVRGAGKENHAWNLVNIGGLWYNTDSTWRNGRDGESFVLFTQEHREESIGQFYSPQRATNVEWDPSMAIPYNYETDRFKFRDIYEGKQAR